MTAWETSIKIMNDLGTREQNMYIERRDVRDII